MKPSSNATFGVASYVSTLVTITVIAVLVALPFDDIDGSDSTWTWVVVGAGFATCVAFLFIGGVWRRIGVGILVAVATPFVLLLTLPLIALLSVVLEPIGDLYDHLVR
ncbi:hypothetical protein [Rhodococcus triatomae]|nr:hypothetical protein G419_05517 [Rhodococcus triatomae BKS 15-14]